MFNVMCVVCCAIAQSGQNDITLTVDNVSEMRASGCCPSLVVELKLSGTDLNRVQGALPAKIDSARTNEGVDVRPDANPENYLLFNEYKDFHGPGPKSVRVTLKPARRSATTVSLKGQMLLFAPREGYMPTIVAKHFLKGSGKPIADPALAERGIDLVAFTKSDYDAYAEKLKSQKGAAKSVAQGAADAIGAAFGDLLGSLFSFGGSASADLILLVHDPKDQLVGVHFIDADGKEIRSTGRSSTFLQRNGKLVYQFGGKSLEDADLAVDLLVAGQTIAVPFEISADLP